MIQYITPPNQMKARIKASGYTIELFLLEAGMNQPTFETFTKGNVTASTERYIKTYERVLTQFENTPRVKQPMRKIR